MRKLAAGSTSFQDPGQRLEITKNQNRNPPIGGSACQKKIIIVNGKKFAIIKKRYKKIYYYPLKKTPLLYLLNKENILNLIQNYKPILVDKEYIEYELIDNNFNTLNIFFDKNSLELSGWKTIDAYSNEVDFLIKNIEINVFIKKKFFDIPTKEDL